MVDASGDVYVHPRGLCESDDVGPGTRIWAFAHVMRGARLGAGCNVGDHAFVETGAWLGDRVTVKNGVMVWEGVTIEDDAFIGPGAIFTNDRHPRSPRMDVAAVTARYADRNRWLEPTRVGRGASLGAGAIIGPGITLGAYCMVGAGTVVSRDVPPHRFVSRQAPNGAGWVCTCGLPLAPAGNRWTCRCGLSFRREGEGLQVVPPRG